MESRLWVHDLKQFGIVANQNYSYPPATLLLGSALSWLPYLPALAVWSLGGWVAFYLAARTYVPFHPAWVLLLPATVSMPNGQYGVFAAALWLFAFRGSGIAAGLLTLKPHLGLLLAVCLLAKHRWMQIAAALAAMILLWATAEAVFQLTLQFATEGIATQASVLTDTNAQPYFAAMPSAYIRLRNTFLAWPAQVMIAMAALAMLWTARNRPLKDLAFPAATATFLVLPYGFSYDMGVVSLGFAILIYRHWTVLPLWQRVVSMLGFLSPGWASIAVEPLILLAGLYVQVRLGKSAVDPAPANGAPLTP